MSYIVTSDMGGTFTDVVVSEKRGAVQAFKALTTPSDPTQGVMAGIQLAAAHYNLDLGEFLNRTDAFIHGSTIATNTIIQMNGAKVGHMTTRGHEASLYCRYGAKKDTFNLAVEYPKPLVRNYLIKGITERITAEGEILVPLDEDEVRAAIHQFRKWQVEAISVCLLWSVANPCHERRIAEIIEAEWPEVPYSISSEVQPAIREWPRASGTVLNAMLKPVMHAYIKKTQRQLQSNGLKNDLLMVVSSGGVVYGADAAENPVMTLLSGPAMGPSAGAVYAKAHGTDQCLVIDMGGTSFDVSMVSDGRPMVTKDMYMEGHPTGVTSVEVLTLGAGGGSIAWVDSGGMLNVGPHSAGADPGPACYRRGGTEATVTDANVVLGYLNPESIADGRMAIDAEAAHQVILEKVAQPLQLDPVEAASGIYRVVNQNMIGAMNEVTTWRGVDPREYLLVAGGGAGGLHVARLASELQIKSVVIPKLAGALCAFGMLNTDIVFSEVSSAFTTSVDFDFARVNTQLAALEARGRKKLRAAGIGEADMVFEYYVSARYLDQVYELEVPLPDSHLSADSLERLIAAFHALHERRYTYRDEDSYQEYTDWRVIARGLRPKVSFREQADRGADATPSVTGVRAAYFVETGGFTETPVYNGKALSHGMQVTGPAIIEEPTSTLVVIPGANVTVTQWGDYLMELGDVNTETGVKRAGGGLYP